MRKKQAGVFDRLYLALKRKAAKIPLWFVRSDNMRIITAVILVMALVFGLTACSETEYSDEEKFAARANLTIDRNAWYYLPDAVDYVFTTIEYFEELGARVIRADCAFRTSSGNIVRNVFLISDNEEYLETLGVRENVAIQYDVMNDTFTELWYINLGKDYEFTPDEENFVSRQSAKELVDKYRQTGDKSYLGM